MFVLSASGAEVEMRKFPTNPLKIIFRTAGRKTFVNRGWRRGWSTWEWPGWDMELSWSPGGSGGLGTARGDLAAALPQCWVSSGASASPRLPRICLEEQGRKRQNSCWQLLPEAPALRNAKPTKKHKKNGGFVPGDSQSLNSAAVLLGKNECVWCWL